MRACTTITWAARWTSCTSPGIGWPIPGSNQTKSPSDQSMMQINNSSLYLLRLFFSILLENYSNATHDSVKIQPMKERINIRIPKMVNKCDAQICLSFHYAFTRRSFLWIKVKKKSKNGNFSILFLFIYFFFPLRALLYYFFLWVFVLIFILFYLSV